MKLNHRATLNSLAIVLLIYGAINFWHVFKYGTAWFRIWAIPCVVGAAGLFASRTWSQYIYYGIAVLTALGWAGFVVLIWPSIAAQHAIRLLLLGAVLVPFCVMSSFLLFRSFRNIAAQNQQSAAPDGTDSLRMS